MLGLVPGATPRPVLAVQPQLLGPQVPRKPSSDTNATCPVLLMLGLVPGIIFRPLSPSPPGPSVQRLPVLALHATSPLMSLMLGLVPAIIPAPLSPPPPGPSVQRLPVLAWNAISPPS